MKYVENKGVGTGNYKHRNKKHDFKIDKKNEILSYSLNGVNIRLSIANFISAINKQNWQNYFDSISFNSKDGSTTYVFKIKTNSWIKGKIRSDEKTWKECSPPDKNIIRLENIKPTIDKPFEKIQFNIDKANDKMKKLQNAELDKIKGENDLEKGIDKSKNHLETRVDKFGHITKKWIGNIIGKTESGKDVVVGKSASDYEGFSDKDHKDASDLYYKTFANRQGMYKEEVRDAIKLKIPDSIHNEYRKELGDFYYKHSSDHYYKTTEGKEQEDARKEEERIEKLTLASTPEFKILEANKKRIYDGIIKIGKKYFDKGGIKEGYQSVALGRGFSYVPFNLVDIGINNLHGKDKSDGFVSDAYYLGAIYNSKTEKVEELPGYLEKEDSQITKQFVNNFYKENPEKYLIEYDAEDSQIRIIMNKKITINESNDLKKAIDKSKNHLESHVTKDGHVEKKWVKNMKNKKIDLNLFKNKSGTDSYLDMKDFWRKNVGYDNDENVAVQKKFFEESNVKTEEVNVEDIIPNQDYLNEETVKKYISEGYEKEPFGVRMKNGKVVVFDGTHRIASEITKGKTKVKMKILKYNFKKPTEKKEVVNDKWYTKYAHYKLSKLPVGVPEEKVKVNLEGDIHSHSVLDWKDPKTGKHQKAYTPEFLRRNAIIKWARIAKCDSRIITSIQTKVKKNIIEGDDKTKQMAAIVGIIAETGLRPGYMENFKKTGNRGVATLSPDNLEFKGNTTIFNFTGKSFKENNSQFTNSILTNYLKDRVEAAKKSGSVFLFEPDASAVVDFFKGDLGYRNLKLKDMRTYIATAMAKDILFKDIETFKKNLSDKESTNLKIIAGRLRDCYSKVAKKLNNTPEMAKTSYIHPNVRLDFLSNCGVATDLIKGEGDDFLDIFKSLDETIALYHSQEDVDSINIDENDEEECDIYNLFKFEESDYGAQKLGCLMVGFDMPEMKAIHDLIDPADLVLVDTDGRNLGLERETHITIMYGFHSEVNPQVVLAIALEQPIGDIRISTPSYFSNERYDVIKFKANNINLNMLNADMADQFPVTNKFAYNPHCTVAYVKPGLGDKYVALFENMSYTVTPKEFIFSSAIREKIIVPLRNDIEKAYMSKDGLTHDAKLYEMVKKYWEWKDGDSVKPSFAGVLEFLQNNDEDVATEKMAKELLDVIQESEELKPADKPTCVECGKPVADDKKCNHCGYGKTTDEFGKGISDYLEKGKKYKVGEISHRKDGAWVKHVDGWVHLDAKGNHNFWDDNGNKTPAKDNHIDFYKNVLGYNSAAGIKKKEEPVEPVKEVPAEKIIASEKATVDINMPQPDKNTGEIKQTTEISTAPKVRIPSPQQQSLFDFVAKGRGNCALDAKAGSGKTTTIIDSLKYIPPGKKIAFVAFSKAIVDELQPKIATVRKDANVSTLHSFGFAAIRKVYPGIRLDKDKNKLVLNEFITAVANKEYPGIDREGERINYMANVYKLISLAKQNLTADPAELAKEAEKLGLPLSTKEGSDEPLEPQLIQTCLNKLLEVKTMIDFDDMIYLPAKYMKIPVDKFDFVFVDEAQDMNKMQLSLAKRMFDNSLGGRLIAVGDPQQAIFGFAGSDENSFNNIADLPNTVRLPLSVSYRCGKDIIKYVRAKTGVNIDFWEHSPDGHVNEDASFMDMKDGDMAICRNTAPLIALCMQLIAKKKAAYIRGREIGEILANQIKRYTPKKLLDSPEGFKKLFEKMEEERMKAHNKAVARGLTPEQAGESSGVVTIKERIECFDALRDDSKTPQEMMQNIFKIFSNTEKGGIQLTSAHRSKGSEADNVHIIEDGLLHGTRAKNEFQRIQENNLRYVAYTRAKKKLNFITDWTFYNKQKKGNGKEMEKGVAVNDFEMEDVIFNKSTEVEANNISRENDVNNAKFVDNILAKIDQNTKLNDIIVALEIVKGATIDYPAVDLLIKGESTTMDLETILDRFSDIDESLGNKPLGIERIAIKRTWND